MTQTIFRNGFFAFLAMILVAVAAVLVLNAPSEASHVGQPPATISEGDEFVPTDSDTKVVDARVENDAPTT